MTTFYDAFGKAYDKPTDAKVEWRISAYGVLENEKGEVLMVEPTWKKGEWMLPGGGVELNESIEQGLAREFCEETGVKAIIEESLPFYISETYFARMSGIYKDNSHWFHSINMVFKMRLMEKYNRAGDLQVIDTEEISKVAWVKKDEINENNCVEHFWPFFKQWLGR